MAGPLSRPEKRKIGVHASRVLEVLAKVDQAAQQLDLSGSELLRRRIEEWTEQASEEAWVASKTAQARDKDRVPWVKGRAELGL